MAVATPAYTSGWGHILRRLAIAFFFDEFGIVDDYMIHLVAALGKFVEYTLFVSNGPLRRESELAIKPVAQEILIRENEGLDVGAYKNGLKRLGYERLTEYDEVILYNHTFFGPIFPFEEMFSEMEMRDCDFWGITNHLGATPNPFTHTGTLHRHIQSHFIAFRKTMVASGVFRQYWESIPEITSYVDSILLHEARLTKHFEDLGYKSDVYIDSKDYGSANATFENVDGTIERRCPILKRRVFFHDPIYHDENAVDLPRALRLIKQTSDYDFNLIWRNIVRSAEPGTLNVNAAQTSIFPDIRLKQSDTPPNPGNIAVCAHIYHIDMAPELFDLASKIPVRFDFIATTDTAEKAMVIEKTFSKLLNIDKLIVRPLNINRGRDMGALFVGCRDLLAGDAYDLVCRIHTKKSPQDGGARAGFFKRHLQENLLNSPGYIANLLDMFLDNPSIGVAVPPIIHRGYPTLGHSWYSNRLQAAQLIERLSLKVKLDPDTPVAAYGGMFWFRPRALRKLFAEEWKWEDFEEEPNYGDGDLPHGLERMICYVAQDAGYLTRQIMCLHRAEQQCTSLEYKLQKMCSFLPPGPFRAQCSLALEWMHAGHPVAHAAQVSEPVLPDAFASAEQASPVDQLPTGFLAELAELRKGKSELANRSDNADRKAGNGTRSDPEAVWLGGADHGARAAVKLVPDLARELAKSSDLTIADRARGNGNWELAAKYYANALQHDPHNESIWLQYAHALVETGELTEAEAACRTALRYDKYNADAHFELGRTLSAQANIIEAENAYLRAFVLGSPEAGTTLALEKSNWSGRGLAELKALLDIDQPAADGMAHTAVP